MRSALAYDVPNCGSLTSMPSSVMFDWSARAPLTAPLRGSMFITAPVRASVTCAFGT